MEYQIDCKDWEVARPEINLLEGDVQSFPVIQVEEPRYDSITVEFEKYGEFRPMFNRIINLCAEFQRVYPPSFRNLNEVCIAYKELDMMVNLHDRLLYPYFNVLRDKQEKHALFDGSIYGVIQVLQNSSDKIRSVLNLNRWGSMNIECEPYVMFTGLLNDLSTKVLAYLDIHDRYIYPEAILLEEGE